MENLDSYINWLIGRQEAQTKLKKPKKTWFKKWVGIEAQPELIKEMVRHFERLSKKGEILSTTLERVKKLSPDNLYKIYTEVEKIELKKVPKREIIAAFILAGAIGAIFGLIYYFLTLKQ